MDALQYYPWLGIFFASILGLIMGSFLNVVIYRLPKMMEIEWRKECADAFPEYHINPPTESLSLSLPRSHCPHCQASIRIRDNIPILSWLFLNGRCHHCHAPISVRYPFIELLSAVCAGCITAHFGLQLYTLSVLLFTLILIAATFIDLDTQLLPDALTMPLLWLGLFTSLLGISPVNLSQAVIGAMAGYLSLWSVFWLFKLCTGKEGMGYGDFKLLAALGAWLGWPLLPLVVVLASVIGIIFGVLQLRLEKKGLQHAFPFGPSLALAGWVVLLWGNPIQHWYFNHILGA